MVYHVSGYDVVKWVARSGNPKDQKAIDNCEIRIHAGYPNNLAGYRLNHSAKLSLNIAAPL